MTNTGQFKKTHGMSNTSTYHAWQAMKSRCDKPSCDAYKDYGARGITYDARWAVFDCFFEDMGEKGPGMTLDRIDNSLGYSKENCRWTSMLVQCNNRRSNRNFEIGGKSQSIAQWAREYGMSRHKLWGRLKAGKTIIEALANPGDMSGRMR